MLSHGDTSIVAVTAFGRLRSEVWMMRPGCRSCKVSKQGRAWDKSLNVGWRYTQLDRVDGVSEDVRGPSISVGEAVTIHIDVFHCHDSDPAQSPFVNKAHSVDLFTVVCKCLPHMFP